MPPRGVVSYSRSMHRAQAARGTRWVALRLLGVAGLIGITGGSVAGMVVPSSAFANSSPYELYCPGTPVGTVVLNNVVTTATITPASPSAGSQFNVTNYQTQANIPSSLATAAAALGNSSITGSATVTVDASGATPASIATPTLSFSVAIPSPVPSTGIALSVPTSPGSVGPFTASGGAITLTQASKADLNLVVSGNTISLNCTAYNNNSAPSGITTTAPSGATISPTIATASASGSSSAATTTPTTTAPAPTTASSGGSLATTGAGPGLYLLAEIGIGGLAAAGLLSLGCWARTRRLAVRGRARG